MSSFISEPTTNLLSSNSFFRGPETSSYLFINTDTNDGYLYKDSKGDYHPDRNDAYKYDDNIKDSVSSVLEFYESIINTGAYNNIGLEDTFVSGSDIHLFINTLDLNIRKVELARRMICLRTKLI